jgi:tetratricopeptide (TPR) repeat protein
MDPPTLTPGWEPRANRLPASGKDRRMTLRDSRPLRAILIAFLLGLTFPAHAQGAGSGTFLQKQAQQDADAGRYIQALATHAEAIAASPDDPAVQTARARLLGLLGHADLAIPDLRRAAQLSPNDAGLQNDLCLTLALANHDLDGALAACNAAVRLEPDNYAMLSTRGYLHLRRGEYAKAEKDYAVALDLYPASANEMFGFGIAIIHLGRETEGRGEIASATLDSAGLVSDWETRGFGIRGEAKPGKPVATASQPIITTSKQILLLNRDEEYVTIANECGRILPALAAYQRAAVTQQNTNLVWTGACRFGLIHGDGKFAGAGADTPASHFAYGREILENEKGAALERRLTLAYEPAERALKP